MRILKINDDQSLILFVDQIDIETLLQALDMANDAITGSVPIPFPTADDDFITLLEGYIDLLQSPRLLDESAAQMFDADETDH